MNVYILILFSIYLVHVLKKGFKLLEGKTLKINYTVFSTEKNKQAKKKKQPKKQQPTTKQTKPKEKTKFYGPYFQSMLFFPVGKFTHSIHWDIKSELSVI